MERHISRTRRSSYSERQSDDYRMRRERNNVAVKKSREKMRYRAKETLVKVAELKQENMELEGKVALLSKELTLLKDLLLAHASGRRYSETENCDGWDDESTTISSQGVQADPASVRLDHLYSA